MWDGREDVCFVWEWRSVGCGRDVYEKYMNVKENGGSASDLDPWDWSRLRGRAIDGHYERLVGA